MIGLGDGVNDDDDDERVTNTMMAINFEIDSEPELEILLIMMMAIFFNEKLFNNVFSYMALNYNWRASSKYGFENHMLETVHMPEMRLLPPSMLKQSTQRSNRTLKESKLSGPRSLVPLINRRVLHMSNGAPVYSIPESDPSVLARRFHKKSTPDAGGRRRTRLRSTRIRK
jgi:hypothetical protein